MGWLRSVLLQAIAAKASAITTTRTANLLTLVNIDFLHFARNFFIFAAVEPLNERYNCNDRRHDEYRTDLPRDEAQKHHEGDETSVDCYLEPHLDASEPPCGGFV